jgi:hypothetical protein
MTPVSRLILSRRVSPTPFLFLPAIGLTTSAPCAYVTTATSYVSEVTYYTSDGTPTAVYTTLPTAIYTATSINFVDAAGMSNTAISTSAIIPFPAGDYSNFTYDGFIKDMGIDVEGGGENVFSLPSYVPSFLAGIPAIRSAYPNIGRTIQMLS